MIKFEEPKKIKYICSGCKSTVTLSDKISVYCSKCGNRVLYKTRTKRVCEYLCI